MDKNTDKTNQTNQDDIYDVIFVGGGVANIFAAHYLTENKPDINFVIIEAGTNVTRRDRNQPADCAMGVHGAGTFSDGKFSYYPSATKLWELELVKLKTAYNFVKDSMTSFHDGIPQFPEELNDVFVPTSKWTLKPYETIFLSLEDRIQLAINTSIKYYDQPNCRFKLQSMVIDIHKEYDHYILVCNDGSALKSKNIVLGGGRFMPLFTQKIDFIPHIFKRIELGVRFEGPAESNLYELSNCKDPKFMKWDAERQIETRTFCWCRRGEVVQTEFNGIRTWSGRSDCDATDRSNFGFNVRFKNPRDYELFNHVLKNVKPFTLVIDDVDNFIQEFQKNYGPVANYIIEGLQSFLTETLGKTLANMKNFKVYGPTIEGVGFYPDTDENLKVIGENIYVTGDATGKFRGTIAAAVSGVFVAQNI